MATGNINFRHITKTKDGFPPLIGNETRYFYLPPKGLLMKSNKTGVSRIIKAFFHSLDGLRAAFKNEAAFRQEVTVFTILLPVLFYLPISLSAKCLLLIVNTGILVAELLNSSIESIVDLVSPDYHILAKQAKDIGSAAVLLSIMLAITVWGIVLFNLIANM